MKKIQNDEALVAFYRDGGAQRVLERYPFEPREQAVVKRAIIAANRPKPHLRTIREADKILQKVITERQPIRPHPYSDLSVETALKQFELAEERLQDDAKNLKTTKIVVATVSMVLLSLIIYAMTRT